MPIDPPPPPPLAIEQPAKPSGPIVDMRGAFARTTPPTEEDRAQARAFIDGKIAVIRRDPYMTDAQKAAATSSANDSATQKANMVRPTFMSDQQNRQAA